MNVFISWSNLIMKNRVLYKKGSFEGLRKKRRVSDSTHTRYDGKKTLHEKEKLRIEIIWDEKNRKRM